MNQKMCQVEPTLKIVPFFLYAIFQLFWHISKLFDTKYQMSICDDDIEGPLKSI